MLRNAFQSPRSLTPKRSLTVRRVLGGIWRWVRLPLVAYLAVVLLMMFLEESLIFFPSRHPAGDWHPPGLTFEDVWFEAADGTRLHGWYVPHDNPRATVLFCHGNAGNLAHRAEMLRVLHEVVGVSALIFDYRGYGRSEGKPNEKGILADARAARAWLARHEGVAENELVLMGRSLGGAVAVDLAAQDGARALVVESSFNTLPDVAAYHYPWLPVRLAMHTRLDSAAKVPDYHGPLLLTHSVHDTIVPYQFGKRLFDAANEPKRMITFDDRDHNDPQPMSYYAELRDFLDAAK